jgi:8-oxo-dGTP pyrophosphatase MutT (NUDIX family)
MEEKFQIPGVAGIIERMNSGSKEILIQERVKQDAPDENGLIEIPAGKIREFENLFDTLRREVFEETGLTVTEIIGENSFQPVKENGYKVIGCEPFYISQNLKGSYPIMVITFICKVTGNMVLKSDESENIRWISIPELEQTLNNYPERFYPMHVSALRKYINAQ